MTGWFYRRGGKPYTMVYPAPAPSAASILRRLDSATASMSEPCDNPTPTPTPAPRYYKVIRKNLIHFSQKYHEGLMELEEPFNTDPTCGEGGLYFCEEKDLAYWITSYNNNELGFIAEITLCPDSRVVKMKDKLKTDKFIVGRLQPIQEFLTLERIQTMNCMERTGILQHLPESLRTPDIWLKIIKDNCSFFKQVPEQIVTDEFIHSAVSCDPCVLHFIPVEKRTYELCRIAASKGILSLVPEEQRTYELCLEAVSHNGYSLNWVPVEHRTPELCLAAFKSSRNTNILSLIPYKNRTYDIYKFLMTKCFSVRLPIEYQNYKFFLDAMKQPNASLHNVPWRFMTFELMSIAFDNNPDSLEVNTWLSPGMAMYLVWLRRTRKRSVKSTNKTE